MFTGIVEKLGRVASIERRAGEGTIRIESGWDLTEIGIGDSISVNGACLTISSLEGTVFSAHASTETLQRTTLGYLPIGGLVNLERALRVSDRLGGHLVTGHVDGVGAVRRIHRQGESVLFEFEISPQVSRTLVEKGSVAVDGISLTVSGLNGRFFQVQVIPHTLEGTTLKVKKPGDSVNIETDIIGKYIEKLLSPQRAGVTLELLKENGFL
jgi:riboflavin synthase